jgi:hypothetical protein
MSCPHQPVDRQPDRTRCRTINPQNVTIIYPARALSRQSTFSESLTRPSSAGTAMHSGKRAHWSGNDSGEHRAGRRRLACPTATEGDRRPSHHSIAALTAVQPRRSPRMLVATSPSPQPSWTTHQAPTWVWWPDAGHARVDATSRPDATREAARLQRRRSQKPANAPTTAANKMVPRASTNHGSIASGLVGGGSTAIPMPRSTTQATAPMAAQRPVIGSSRRDRSDERGR